MRIRSCLSGLAGALCVLAACGDDLPGTPTDAAPDQGTPGSLVIDVDANARTTEVGGMATFTVRLATQPAADVIVPVVSGDPGEGTASPATLTFTPASWSTAQTVTVVGVDDLDRDGLVSYAINLGASTSADGAWVGVTGSASVMNADNDAPGITVSALSGATAEDGTTATFTVVLDAIPQSDVTIAVATASDEVGISAPTLVFTAANWQTPQTVTLTGQDDDLDDGDQVADVDLGPITGTDTGYTGLTLADLTVTNVDDDQAGVIVSSAAGSTTEAGGTTTFTVVLTSEPTATVTVTPTSNATDEGVVSGALTFDATDWDQPKTVTVTGQNDDVDDGDITFSITTASTSADPAYGLTPSPISVINVDDDTANIVVTPSGTATTELGGTITVSVVLASEPTAAVTVNLSSSDTNEGVLSAGALTFDASNWDLAQVVTVTGQNDNVLDGSKAYQVVFSAPTTTDSTYAAILPAAIDLINFEMLDVVFNFTAAPELFTVPTGVTALEITLEGAQGGANWVNNTNFGGEVTATVMVTPGEQLGVYVGGQSMSATVGGWNGGGAGEGAGRGGGGASDVRRGGSALSDRILVAGGGGGAGYWSNLHVVGGVGGGAVGVDGADGYRDPSYAANPGGRGATQTRPGDYGTCISFNNPTTAGALGQGGAPSGCGCEGYGGGGGYYGGAGSGNCRGGGGGSGFVTPTGTSDVTSTAGGADPGNGQILIRWRAPVL